MTVTQADIVAAREGIDMIPKEAEMQKAAEPWIGNQAAADYEAKYKGSDEEKYWQDRYLNRVKVMKAAGMRPPTKQEFAAKWTKKIADDAAEYRKNVAAGGGMLDRYSGSAGGLGAGIGALLGGLFGGEQGAIVGSILGGLGLYLAQKGGLFEGTEIEKMFRTAVDKVYGDPVTPEQVAAKQKVMQSALNPKPPPPISDGLQPSQDTATNNMLRGKGGPLEVLNTGPAAATAKVGPTPTDVADTANAGVNQAIKQSMPSEKPAVSQSIEPTMKSVAEEGTTDVLPPSRTGSWDPVEKEEDMSWAGRDITPAEAPPVKPTVQLPKAPDTEKLLDETFAKR